MKKELLIFDADGQEMFDAMKDNFVAKVVKIGDYYAVKIDTDFVFYGGIYQDEATANLELHKFLKEVSKAKCGSYEYDGYGFGDSDTVSALELISSFEENGYFKNKGLLENETAKMIDELTDELISIRCKDLAVRNNL